MHRPWAHPGKQGPVDSIAARNEAEESSLEQNMINSNDADLSERVTGSSRA